MFDSKYGNVLTALLVVVIIAIVGLLGFFGYDAYQKYFITKDTEEFVDSFSQDISVENKTDQSQDQDNNSVGTLDGIESTEQTTQSSGRKVKYYKGFVALGTIEIPKTKVKYPVLERVTKKSIETAVAILFGPGLNQPGNTVIVGHNYRNGLFFSNNKKLSNGDKIYITDLDGNKVTYTIYNKYETSPEDTEYMTRNTNGAREISLSTCTDDSSARIIIWAKADGD